MVNFLTVKEKHRSSIAYFEETGQSFREAEVGEAIWRLEVHLVDSAANSVL